MAAMELCDELLIVRGYESSRVVTLLELHGCALGLRVDLASDFGKRARRGGGMRSLISAVNGDVSGEM